MKPQLQKLSRWSTNYIYTVFKIFLFDIFTILLIFVFTLTRKYRRLSPGLILVRKKRTLAMDLSLPATIKIWRLNNHRKNLPYLKQWFKEGFMELYNETQKETIYNTFTNKLFYTLLERLIKKEDLNVTIRKIESLKEKQITSRLTLVSPLSYYKILILLLLRNKKAIEIKDHWNEELEVFNLEITIHK